MARIKKSQGFILYILILLGLSCGTKHERPELAGHAENYFAELDFSRIVNGDIILKRGKGTLSSMIAGKLNEKIPLSHCGILIKTKDTVYVIHSVAKELSGIDGVQSISLDEFTRDCLPHLLYIVRFKSENSMGDKIAENARHFLDSAIPFDYELNYYNPSKVNCSELVYRILLNNTGKDFFEKIPVNNKKALSFNSLLDSSHFEIIYNY